MSFALGLRDSLRVRQSRVRAELANGESLERVLSRHLLAVEQMADGNLLTSVLLLDSAGKRLWHGAAPNLPPSYCEAIDGSEIGPCAGSCGTAAYHGRPVYVTDIASDPLWANYRHLALPHELRACWSTPIRDTDDAVIGTFAIYRRTIGRPMADEIEAIRMITDHVAQAIMWARNAQDLYQRQSIEGRNRSSLKIVLDRHATDPRAEWAVPLLESLEKLESRAVDLDRSAEASESKSAGEALRAAAADCRRLISVIRSQIERHNSEQ